MPTPENPPLFTSMARTGWFISAENNLKTDLPLRDLFAAAALAGLMAQFQAFDARIPIQAASFATTAFTLADAMLQSRAVTP